jgi:DNA primase
MEYVIRGELEKLGVGKITPGRSGWLNCRCPFHKDNDPSFGVNSVTGAYKCFGCGIRGPHLQAFLSLVYGKEVDVNDFISSQQFFLSKINGRYNRSLDDILCYENENKFEEYYRALATDFYPVQTIEWANKYLLQHRRLSQDTIDRSGILFASGGDYSERLIFPMDPKVGFHSRLILTEQSNSGKWKMCVNNVNFQSYVHGVADITDDLYCIVCESVLDRLFLMQCGYKNVITTLSTNFTSEQYMQITRFKKFIFCYDMDENESGQKKARQHTSFILRNMSEKECYIAELPLQEGQKKKDPNECSTEELHFAFSHLKKMKIRE